MEFQAAILHSEVELLQKNPGVLCLQEGGKVVKCSANWMHSSTLMSSDVCFSLRGYLLQEQGDSRDCPATQAVFASQGVYPIGKDGLISLIWRAAFLWICAQESFKKAEGLKVQQAG